MSVDRLEALLARFPVRTKTVHGGEACNLNDVSPSVPLGQLHIVQGGGLEVRQGAQLVTCIDEPSLLLYPRLQHRSRISGVHPGTNTVCADIVFEGGDDNPIVASLPHFVCLPLSRLEGCEPVLAALFAEAGAQRCGRQAVLDRLLEVVLVHVLRELMESDAIRSGMLSGMAHDRLRRALVAIHEAPAREWTLRDLAAAAGMSRTVFATCFRETIGCTPGQYIQRWRMALAQKRLRQGHPLKRIAWDIGYNSEAALSRAFRQHTGHSPSEWKRATAMTG